ncbi:MAG: SAM-dependent methyltransferase, partial [Pseudomonadota bacterium]
MQVCSVCGGQSFKRHEVLWPGLISEWGLAPHEVDYINRQQGELCEACGANLRQIALSDALLDAWGSEAVLRETVARS